MGVETFSFSVSIPICFSTPCLSAHRRPFPIHHFHQIHLRFPTIKAMERSSPSILPLTCIGQTAVPDTHVENPAETSSGARQISLEMLQELVSEALVWSSLHGLVVGDKIVQRSAVVPGVGLVHAPISLLPTQFPENHWRQACELTPIFNELVDRVSLDSKFLQDSLSRTKKVDVFTSRLLDIHSKMLEMNKKEEIHLGLHRSDYMLDAQTKELLQIELNTISSSFPGLSCLVSKLHRNLLDHYGKNLGLDPTRVPGNTAVGQFAGTLAKAWNEYNNNSAVVMFVVQAEERNVYDQYWLSSELKESLVTMVRKKYATDFEESPIVKWLGLLDLEVFWEYSPDLLRYGVTSIRRTLSEIDREGKVLPDGALCVGKYTIAVVYFRAGYSPNDYPSESEWNARLLIEQSCAIKCPSISYHLVGTKKIQQELAKPNVLERFLDNKDDIAKLQKCFAGLWSLLEDSNIVHDAMERPELYVLKPQREGGGNNIYGNDVRETLVHLQKEGNEGLAAYILMQRIFPTASIAYLVRDGICHQDHAISELGIYGAYLRNKEKVIVNERCGYLMRTKVSSSNEGGVAAGFAVLDSVYLT